MSNRLSSPRLTRRDLIKAVGSLVVTVVVPRTGMSSVGSPRDTDPTNLDTWLAVDSAGKVTAYWGKMDMGQGVDTAIAQLIADELDVDVDDISVVIGDTARCANQGGASGSTGLQRSGVAFQHAAAEARLVLMEKASSVLASSVETLETADGAVRVAATPARSVSYAELIGEKSFETAIEWNGRLGNSLALKSRAALKSPKDYRVVGTSVPRKDITDKLLARTEFLHDVELPNMWHARVIRPSRPGSKLIGVDTNSIRGLPELEVLTEGDFVAVAAPSEWHAIKAARQLKVEWDEADAGLPVGSDGLHDWIRAAPVTASKIETNVGDVDAVKTEGRRRIGAEYEWPFQSHARMAPAAAVADVQEDSITVWTDSQKPYDTASGAGLLLEQARPSQPDGSKARPVRAIWKPGPGSYGRSDAGDGAMDAVLISEKLGRPVRVQWMREDGHKWDPKGPASVIRCRATLDNSDVLAYHFHVKGFSRHDQNSRENEPGETLAGHLVGHQSMPRWTIGEPADSYVFPNKRYSWETIAPLRKQASPLRTAHFRDPYGPEIHFASESFIDEMAFASGVDPVAFRLDRVEDERDAAVIRAASALSGWTPRTKPRMQKTREGDCIGTGIAYAQRGGSVNAVVAEVVVSPTTGRLRVTRAWVGADHGLVVNPFTLERTIEGNLLQATSRTLFEEVRFTQDDVLTRDWASYPILEARDAPDEILIRHVNRPDLGPRGAGEPTTRVMPPAIANAFFDATGVRLRRVPFTPERVKVALQAG